MRAILTVIGKDQVGILAQVANKCSQFNANVEEVTQSILQDLFCMIMLIDISKVTCELSELVYEMNRLGEENGLSIHVMHEDVFNSMHHI